MLKNTTYVAFEKLLTIVTESGLPTTEKKSCLRVDGPNGSKVYLPKRKRVGRVLIGNFSAPEGTSNKLGDRSFGSISEDLDMTPAEEKVLENFRAVLKHMASLSSSEEQPTKPQAPDMMVSGGQQHVQLVTAGRSRTV